MTSPFALRALGAIALPGAFLAAAAPTASAVEVAPLSNVDSGNTTQSTESDAAAGETSALPETSELMSGQTFSL